MTAQTKVRQSGNVAIIDLGGRAILGGTTAFRDTIREIAAGGGRNVVVNLCDLTYIDSAGIGELVASLAAVAKAGGSMKLLNPSPRVRELLQITRVHTLFEIFEDEPSALQSFA